MKCEELNKSRAEKFYAPSTLQKTEKKIEWTRAEKRDTFYNSQLTRQLSWAIYLWAHGTQLQLKWHDKNHGWYHMAGCIDYRKSKFPLLEVFFQFPPGVDVSRDEISITEFSFLINSEEFWLTGSLKAERFLFSSCWFFLSSDISSWIDERKTLINEWMHKYTMAGDLNNDNNNNNNNNDNNNNNN